MKLRIKLQDAMILSRARICVRSKELHHRSRQWTSNVSATRVEQHSINLVKNFDYQL